MSNELNLKEIEFFVGDWDFPHDLALKYLRQLLTHTKTLTTELDEAKKEIERLNSIIDRALNEWEGQSSYHEIGDYKVDQKKYWDELERLKGR